MPGLREGFRERLAAFVRITSGAVTTVGANGAILTRGAGSFLSDGFVAGEEVTVTGFATPANNGVAVLKSVTATQLTTDKTFTTEAAGAPVTVEVRVPSVRVWENRVVNQVVGRPYVEEKLTTARSERESVGPQSRVRVPGTYELRLCYPPGIGTDAIEVMASGLVNWFHSGIPPLPLDNGLYAHLRSASRLGAIMTDAKRASLVVSVAFDSYFTNPI